MKSLEEWSDTAVLIGDIVVWGIIIGNVVVWSIVYILHIMA